MVRSFKLIEDDGTSLPLSDLTPVLPPSVERRYALDLLRLLWYGDRARRPRGCVATRSRSLLRRAGPRAAAELQLGDCGTQATGEAKLCAEDGLLQLYQL